MTQAGPGPGAGSLAEEVVRLIEAIGLTAQHGGGRPEDGAAPECRVCPLCRVIAALRQLRPEVVEHLAAAGEELLAAARELAASSAGASAGAPTGEPAGAPDGSPDGDARPARTVERIELD